MISDYSADRLIQIAIALSAEKNIDKLLDMILQEAIMISNCDSGTVYVREKEQLFFHNTYTGAGGFVDSNTLQKKNLPPVPLKVATSVPVRCLIKRRSTLRMFTSPLNMIFPGQKNMTP